MRKWSKTLAWMVAFVIAGSLVSTAVAAEVSTTITLKDGDGCNASLVDGNINLGTWAWNGAEYELTEDSETPGGAVTIKLTKGTFDTTDNKCAVTLESSSLQRVEGDGEIEGILQFVKTGQSTRQNPLSINSIEANVDIPVTVVVSEDIDDKLVEAEPGTYTGTITVTTSEAP